MELTRGGFTPNRSYGWWLLRTLMESQSTLTSATVTDVSPRQIYRKPVLNGLINEDARAA